ncbi:MAG: PAS domain S-box protein [bacterium]
MALTKKALIILTASLLIMTSSMFFIARFILFKHFTAYENRTVAKNVHRTVETLNQNLMALNTMLIDWSCWDDLYDYARDGNSRFEASNLQASSFVSGQFNVMALIDNAGHYTFRRSVNLDYGADMDVGADEWTKLLKAVLDLGKKEPAGAKGLYRFDERPMLIAIHPVLTSDRKGPSPGILVIGRFFDNKTILQMSKSVAIPLHFWEPGEYGASGEDRLAEIAMSGKVKSFVRVLNNKTSAGYTRIDDMYGKELLFIGFNQPREISATARHSFVVLFITSVACGFVIIFLTLTLLTKYVLRPLRKIVGEIISVAKSDDPSRRLSIGSGAELGKLPESINRMLESLEKSRAALQISEERYREIINNNPIGFFRNLLGEDDAFLLVNPALARMFGYDSPEEMMQHKMKEMYADPEEKHVFAQIIQREGRALSREMRFRRKDGTVFWGLASASIGFDESGIVSHIDGMIEDISARKQAEEALMRIQKAVESASDAIAIADPHGVHIYQNKAFTNLFEYSAEELSEPMAGAALYEDTKAGLKLFESGKRGESINSEIMMVSKSGRRFLVAIRGDVIKDDKNNILGLFVIFSDITARKLSEEKLRISEERYRQLVDNTDTGFVVIGSDGIVIEANEAYMRLVGADSVGELIGRSVIEWTSPDERENNSKAVTQCAEKGYIQDFETTYLRKDGKTVNILINATLQDSAAGKQLVSLCRDITDRKQAEAEREKTIMLQSGVSLLMQSVLAPAPLEEKLKMITDGIVSIFGVDFNRIWLIRPGDLCEKDCCHSATGDVSTTCRRRDKCLHLMASSGRYTHTDGASHRRVPFGFYKIGRVASDEEHKFLTNDVLNEPRVHNHEWARELGLESFAGYQMRIPGGETIGVLALFSKHQIAPAEDAMLDMLSSNVALVIQQALAEEAMIESEERYRRLFDLSSDAIMTTDETGFLSCNKATLKAFGYDSAEEFCKLHPADVSPPFQADGVPSRSSADQHITAAFKKGYHLFEWIHRRKNGEDFHAEVLLAPIDIKNKTIIQATVRDITERKQIEQMKNDFISTVSHELRTPLTSLRGSLGLLAGGVMGELPEDMRELVDIARTNTDRLTRLINDILDLQKMETGRIRLELKEADLNEITQRSIAEMTGFADSNNVRLSFNGAPFRVMADSDRVLQVLDNLISNAVKFSPPDSEIRIFTERKNNFIAVHVSDTGEGIPDEFRDKVFQRFQQADGSSTRKKGGTGLGLSICKSIVESHGGEMWFESEPGRGSTFSFSLKCAETQLDVSACEPETAASPSSPARRLLIVNNNPAICDMLSSVFKKEGLVVDVAADGNAAIEIAAANQPNAIIMDTELPDQIDFDILRRLKESESTRDIPVIFVSGASPENRGDVQMSPVVDWFKKPIDFERLLKTALLASRDNPKPHALIIDDDKELLRFLRTALESAGVRVTTAASGKKGMERLNKDIPDLIILDVMMPEGDGFFVSEQLRKNPAACRVPVVVFTGKELTQDERNRLTGYMTRFFTKLKISEEEFTGQVMQIITGLPDREKSARLLNDQSNLLNSPN